MGGYQVSYPVLTRQGEILQEVARELDGYMERVDAVCSRLEDDDLLADVRKNLQSLARQLAESRAVLHTSGKVLDICVESYSHVETAAVKKVDAARAHNRDFYKNPVIVISNSGPVQIQMQAVPPAATSAGSAPGPTSVPEHFSTESIGVDVPLAAESRAVPHTSSADSVYTPPVFTTEEEDAFFMSSATESGFTEDFPVFSTEGAPVASSAPMETPVVPPDLPSPSAAETVPEKMADGFSHAAMAAGVASGAAAGAAAGAGGLFGAQKLRAYLKAREKEVLEQEVPVLDLTSCEDEELEEMLVKARVEVEKYQKQDDTQETEV